jgi:hypothetical protein
MAKALHDAVDWINPANALPRIRARIRRHEMKRYQVKIVRIGDTSDSPSVAEVLMILEDNTGDDIHLIEIWAEDFVARWMPGYHVSEIVELG